jgi:hypothetical protein
VGRAWTGDEEETAEVAAERRLQRLHRLRAEALLPPDDSDGALARAEVRHQRYVEGDES